MAVLLNVVLLFVWGAVLRHLEDGTRREVFAAGTVSAAFGLALVAFKVFVH